MQNPIAFGKKIIKKSYRAALRSIVFYPVFISFALFCFAFLTLSLENFDFVSDIKENSSYLFIEDVDTARTILSTLIASILSLTVFSFTMVMVVLNQASSNFSPRLLPGLVSSKKHQIILGCYVGTLLYCTIVLISLGAYELEHRTVGMSTTAGAILGLCCVGLFVSFIHNISGAVQIQNIVGEIYTETGKKLDKQIRQELIEKTPLQYLGMDDFITHASPRSGYFQGFDVEIVDSELFDIDLQLVVIPYSGQHIWEGSPLMKLSRRLTEAEEQAMNLACTISQDLHEGNHPMLGLIKFMEVAVRAMSPGINDPGTALDVVHKLGPLLKKMIGLPAFTSVNHTSKGIVVTKTNISTSRLLETIVQPIRQYANNNTCLMVGLIRMLNYLKAMAHISKEDKELLNEEIQAIGDDVRRGITNPKDKERILAVLNT